MKRRGDFAITVAELFGGLPISYRKALAGVPDSPHSTADTAAVLLGCDLWYEPLAEFREYLIASGERPHLWTFTFGASAAWNHQIWDGLNLSARLARSRAGSLCRRLIVHATPWSLQMLAKPFREGIDDLSRRGMCVFLAEGRYVFEPIATAQELEIDLALVEIIAHWLWMLNHRDRVLADPRQSGFEVLGYGEACGRCRERWGIRGRDARWVPPFHPGCRCYAQPRFAQTV